MKAAACAAVIAGKLQLLRLLWIHGGNSGLLLLLMHREASKCLIVMSEGRDGQRLRSKRAMPTP